MLLVYSPASFKLSECFRELSCAIETDEVVQGSRIPRFRGVFALLFSLGRTREAYGRQEAVIILFGAGNTLFECASQGRKLCDRRTRTTILTPRNPGLHADFRVSPPSPIKQDLDEGVAKYTKSRLSSWGLWKHCPSSRTIVLCPCRSFPLLLRIWRRAKMRCSILRSGGGISIAMWCDCLGWKGPLYSHKREDVQGQGGKQDLGWFSDACFLKQFNNKRFDSTIRRCLVLMRYNCMHNEVPLFGFHRNALILPSRRCPGIRC